MKISREEVVHVANLARLDLTPEEVESMTKQLDRILSYVDKLEELNTEKIEPTSHALSVCNAFREDETKGSLSRDDALKNGPAQDGAAFIVPRVI